MIGPHQGKELELMLAGDKKLAMFHDALPDDGVISEEIIPEAAFAPYVAAGTIKRFARDIENMRKGGIIRYVCFTLLGEEWRAEFVLWLNADFFEGKIQHNPAYDEIIGRLLGYADEDIQEFLNQ